MCMNRIGKITSISINSRKVRVLFEDLDAVSFELRVAKHINMSTLSINDEVLISFMNEKDLKSGIVIAEI